MTGGREMSIFITGPAGPLVLCLASVCFILANEWNHKWCCRNVGSSSYNCPLHMSCFFPAFSFQQRPWGPHPLWALPQVFQTDCLSPLKTSTLKGFHTLKKMVSTCKSNKCLLFKVTRCMSLSYSSSSLAPSIPIILMEPELSWMYFG